MNTDLDPMKINGCDYFPEQRQLRKEEQ